MFSWYVFMSLLLALCTLLFLSFVSASANVEKAKNAFVVSRFVSGGPLPVQRGKEVAKEN